MKAKDRIQASNARQGQIINVPSQPIAPAQPVAPQSEPTAPLTQEEIEFDEQFRKWQEEFDNWKKANVNHPDRVAYQQYEQQFESVRQKLVQVIKKSEKGKIFTTIEILI